MARWHPRAPHTRSLLAAALVLSVAACGDDHTDDEGAVPTDGTSAVTSPSTLPTTVPDTPASSVPESTVAGDTTLADQAVARAIAHARGAAHNAVGAGPACRALLRSR